MRRMELKKFIFAFVFVLFSLFILAGCGEEESGQDEIKKASISVEDEIELQAKESFVIDYTILNGNEDSITFESDDETIATVDEVGEVVGKKDGVATITIKVKLTTGETIEKQISVIVSSSTTYKITFQLNGGKCDVQYGEIKAGETYVLPTPTKNNADFLGWSMSGVSGYITEVKDITSNVTVRANWLSYYKVTYSLDGGTYKAETETVKEGTTVALETPTKAGNTFLGWSLSKSGTSYVTSLNSVNSNCTVYAIWDPAKIDITFDTDGGTYTGNKYVVYGSDLKLGVAHKFDYNFLGWTKEKGSTDYISTLTNVTEPVTLYANYESNPGAIDMMVTNLEEDGVPYLTTLQLELAYNPSSFNKTKISYTSSNEKIFTVSDKGLITANKVGVATLTIVVNGTQTLTENVEITVYIPGYFTIGYETTSYATVGETIQLVTTYTDKKGNEKAVSYKSLNSAIASAEKTGKVKGVKEGLATIRAYLTEDENIYFDYTVSIISSEMSDAMKLVLSSHESNVFTRYELGIGAGSPVYDADIIGSVSDLLYNEEYVVNRKWEATQAGISSNHGGVMSSVEFITVHYTGNMAKGADGNANAGYFASGGGGTSIHYTTGNDGIYSCLADNLVGFHAGDGTGTKFQWYATGVKVKANDPEKPVFGINSDSMFTINGSVTTVSVPTGTTEATKKVTGNTFYYNGTQQNCINDMGLAYKVINDEYYMGTTYWCYTQVAAGRICNHGGNNNSIGIESCVNEGSDLWYTWHKTAQLVAHLMVENSLDITRVVGHHFFSAKNCPQPMLENNMEIWYKFIDLVESEYDKLTKYNDYTFTFEILSGQTENTVRASQDPSSKIITYKVTVTKGGKTETVTLASAMNGYYTK